MAMIVLVLILLTIDIDLGEYNPNISNKPACLRYPRNNNVTINNFYPKANEHLNTNSILDYYNYRFHLMIFMLSLN